MVSRRGLLIGNRGEKPQGDITNSETTRHGFRSREPLAHETWGDMREDRGDHILEHFHDKYYVPSLLMNAVKEIPVSQAAMSSIGYWFKSYEETCDMFEKIGAEQVKKSLTRYLKRRLGMAA